MSNSRLGHTQGRHAAHVCAHLVLQQGGGGGVGEAVQMAITHQGGLLGPELAVLPHVLRQRELGHLQGSEGRLERGEPSHGHPHQTRHGCLLRSLQQLLCSSSLPPPPIALFPSPPRSLGRHRTNVREHTGEREIRKSPTRTSGAGLCVNKRINRKSSRRQEYKGHNQCCVHWDWN